MTQLFSQKFSKGWLFLLVPILILTTYGGLSQNENSMRLVVFSILILAIIIFIYSTILQYKIEPEAISFRWKPLQKNYTRLEKADIKKLEIIRYPFIGYGFRVSRKYGSVHNTAGAIGLQIETNQGNKILLGIGEVAKTKETLKECGYEF